MNKTKPLFSTLLLLLSLFAITSYAQPIEQRIDSLYNQYNDRPGYVVSVYKNGEIDFQKGYGLSNLEYGITLSPQSSFDIASVSKQFTALCILLLEQEGQLSLDDPLHKYIKELPEYPQGPVTIRHALYHISGIKEYLKYLIATGNTYNDYINENMAVNILTKLKTLNFKPGFKYEYSNSNFLLLARVVREVSGISIGQFAKEHIFDPLEMTETFIMEDHNKIVKNRAIGYYETEDGNFKRSSFYNYALGGAGQIYTTPQDFFKWNENFKSFEVGSQEILDKMLTSGRFNDSTSTGEGIALKTETYNGLEAFGYEGWFGGYISKYLRFPNQDVALFVISNHSNFNMGAYYALADLYLKDSFKKVELEGKPKLKNIETIKLPIAALKSFEGQYWQNEQSLSRKIYLLNDTLRFQNDNNHILPIKDDKFLLVEEDSQTKAEFTTDKTNQKVFRLLFDTDKAKDYTLYKPVDYNTKELEKFIGNYHNPDFDVTYNLEIVDNKIRIYINGLAYTYITPVMKNKFTSKYYGDFKFKETNSNKINGFEFLELIFIKE